MSSLADSVRAAKLKAEQQQRKRLMKTRKAARREAAINDRRCFEVGRVVCARFPELQKYQPQYGDAVSDAVHDEFAAVVELLSSDWKLLDWLKTEALNSRPGQPNPKESL